MFEILGMEVYTYLHCKHLACTDVIEVYESRRETFVDDLIYVMLITTYVILMIHLACRLRENRSGEEP